jgi:hypothetical protein
MLLGGEQVPRCMECGALVGNVEEHERFHSILSGHAWALAVIKTSHIAAHVHDKYDVPERIDSKTFDSFTGEALAEVMASMPEEAHTIDVGYVHTGQYTVPDGTWECSETCPHPTHEGV